HRPGGGGKLVGFKAQPLKHRNEEVWQGIVVGGVKGQVLAVLETSPGEEGREVGRDMSVSVAKIRAVENHGSVEERFAALPNSLQPGKEIGEQLHVPFVDRLQLR